MDNLLQLLIPEFVLRGHDCDPQVGMAVLIDGSKIKAVGPTDDLLRHYPEASPEKLPKCLLMPGLVNSHQHGRGVSQVQLGYPDQQLELWMAQRRSRSSPDLKAIGMLASAEMLRNGVTCAVHADLAYGTGDYESELHGSIAGYLDVGVRACIAVGVCDQGNIVFPQEYEAAFLAGLTDELRHLLKNANDAPYEPNWEETKILMERLLAKYRNEKRLSFCYGPSGPQWVTDELFRQAAADAREKNIGLHIHALETLAQYEACRRLYPNGLMRHLRDLGAVGPRTVIAHGVFLTDDDIDVLAEEGASVATNPGSNIRLCDATARVHELLAKGVRVGVGSDNSAVMDDEDLFSEARIASLLVGRRSWKTPPRATARQTIRMLTEDGAHMAGFGGRLGRIEPGFEADLAAFSLDFTRGVYLDPDMPLIEAMLSRARGADVRMTMVGGRILYKDGHFPHLDIETIRAKAGDAARRARLPADPSFVDLTFKLRPKLAEFYSELTKDVKFPDYLS